jgi:Leucine-rich repeat (LRR) protein
MRKYKWLQAAFAIVGIFLLFASCSYGADVPSEIVGSSPTGAVTATVTPIITPTATPENTLTATPASTVTLAPTPTLAIITPTPSVDLDEYGRHKDDVAALSEIIAQQTARGATVGKDLDSEQYVWEKGRLTEIHWSGVHLSGDIDFDRLSKVKIIQCASNKLTSVDVSKLVGLKILGCQDNQLTNLILHGQTGSAKNLEVLDCSQNKLEELNVSGLIDLMTLLCSDNLLTDLDVSGISMSLRALYCSYNRLKNLNIGNNLILQDLICSYNQLSSLDISKLTNLMYLECNSNQIEKLDVRNLPRLIKLRCENNLLTNLSVNNFQQLEYVGYDSTVSIAGTVPIVGTMEMVPNISTAGLTPTPSEDIGAYEYHKGDMAAINEIIAQQAARGATVSEDLGSMQYRWEKGRLTGIVWIACHLSGDIDFSTLSKLKIIRCEGNELTSLAVGSLQQLEYIKYDSTVSTVGIQFIGIVTMIGYDSEFGWR